MPPRWNESRSIRVGRKLLITQRLLHPSDENIIATINGNTFVVITRCTIRDANIREIINIASNKIYTTNKTTTSSLTTVTDIKTAA